MYTEQDLLAQGTKARLIVASPHNPALRRPETIVGTVMSDEEVDRELAAGPDRLMACGVVIYSDMTVFFMTDDTLLGHETLRTHGFHSCLFRVPMQVSPRPEVESGIITSARELAAVFYDDERRLHSMDELLQYLNGE